MILVVLFVWFIIELTNTVYILLVFLLSSMGDALWGKQQQNKENWLWLWSHSWANRPNFLLKLNTVLYCLVWHKLFWFKNLIMLMHICSLTLCDYLSSVSTGLHCVRLRTIKIICTFRIICFSASLMDTGFSLWHRGALASVSTLRGTGFSQWHWGALASVSDIERHWLQSVALTGIGFSQWHWGALASVGDIEEHWLQSVTLRGTEFSQWHWGALASVVDVEGHWLQSVTMRVTGFSWWRWGALASVSDIEGHWLQLVTLRGIGFSQWRWGALNSVSFSIKEHSFQSLQH